MSVDVAAKIADMKNAIAEFEAQYTKYAEQNVNTAGSRSRKALMLAKKAINQLRKEILVQQKAKKAEKKTTKADAPAATGANGKKGKAPAAPAAEAASASE